MTTAAKTTRGYTAIRIEHIDPRAEKLTFTAKKDINIEGINGASVNIKAGEKFYAVRATSLGDNMFYIVREVVGVKKCSCPAMCVCKHEKLIAAYKATKIVKVSQRAVSKPTQQPVVVSPKVASEPQHYTMSKALHAKLASLAEEKAVKVEETEVVIEETEAIVVSPEIVEEASDLDIEQEVARQLSLLNSAKIDSLRWIARCRGVNIKSRTRQGLIDAIIASVREMLESEQKVAA